MRQQAIQESAPDRGASDMGAPFFSPAESWRQEVDEIIAGICPRPSAEPSAPSKHRAKGATGVLPQSTGTGRANPPGRTLDPTLPAAPCQEALKLTPSDPRDRSSVEQTTAPVHPTTQATLRAACQHVLEGPMPGQVPNDKAVGTAVAPEGSARLFRPQLPREPHEETSQAAASDAQSDAQLDAHSDAQLDSVLDTVSDAVVRRGRLALRDQILDAITEVHGWLGPGLPPTIYAQCLVQELRLRGLEAVADVPMSVSYKGEVLEDAFRVGLVVEKSWLVDVKGVARIEAIHEAHVRTFLMQSGLTSALLVNFHASRPLDTLREIDGSEAQAVWGSSPCAFPSAFPSVLPSRIHRMPAGHPNRAETWPSEDGQDTRRQELFLSGKERTHGETREQEAIERQARESDQTVGISPQARSGGPAGTARTCV